MRNCRGDENGYGARERARAKMDSCAQGQILIGVISLQILMTVTTDGGENGEKEGGKGATSQDSRGWCALEGARARLTYPVWPCLAPPSCICHIPFGSKILHIRDAYSPLRPVHYLKPLFFGNNDPRKSGPLCHHALPHRLRPLYLRNQQWTSRPSPWRDTAPPCKPVSIRLLCPFSQHFLLFVGRALSA